MKIFLLKKCDLGESGDIVNASDGYARNFLIPKEYAIELSEATEKHILAKKKQNEQIKNQEKKRMTVLSKKVEEEVLYFNVRAHNDGKLYGSICEEEIVKKLSEKGIVVKKKQVVFDKEDEKGLKKVGTYYIKINLSSTLQSKLKVKVASLDR